MACKREARKRHNTIAFWLSDEEKAMVEARIILSGLSKGEYYRSSILGEKVTVTAGNYMSNRVAIVLEKLLQQIKEGNTEEELLLMEMIKQLLDKNENVPADNKDISK